MKKQVKIISIILIVMMILTTMSSIVLAAPDLSNKISQIGEGDSDAETGKIIDFGKTAVTIMQTVGIVVAVVVLLVLGIKYMMGSAEEKAEYKKTMIPYVVGAVLIFAATTIVNIVYQLANGLNE